MCLPGIVWHLYSKATRGYLLKAAVYFLLLSPAMQIKKGSISFCGGMVLTIRSQSKSKRIFYFSFLHFSLMKNEAKNQDGTRKLLRTARLGACMRRALHRNFSPSLSISAPRRSKPENTIESTTIIRLRKVTAGVMNFIGPLNP